jgi:hypothetical protein
MSVCCLPFRRCCRSVCCIRPKGTSSYPRAIADWRVCSWCWPTLPWRACRRWSNCAPGEWGKLLGLDRIPEALTLRNKIALLSDQRHGKAWSPEPCAQWMGADPVQTAVLYVDGHQTAPQRHHYRLVMLEPFVETPGFKATCYKAANWIHLGHTGGLGRLGPARTAECPDQRLMGLLRPSMLLGLGYQLIVHRMGSPRIYRRYGRPGPAPRGRPSGGKSPGSPVEGDTRGPSP